MALLNESFRAALARCFSSSLYCILTLTALNWNAAHAAPVCSTGSDGIVVIGGAATRVNVYYPAPDPAVVETIVAAGSTSIPIDAALGGQATNLHSSISTTIVAGDILIIAQMMGSEIDTTDNHQSTGDYGDGAGGLTQAGTLNTANLIAGQYEFVIATGPVTGGAIPIEGAGIGNGLINGYVNSNVTTAALGYRRYQVIKVPQFANLNITGEVVSDRWNGRWGGVSALNVREDLSIQGGSFNADGRGFRGGQFFPERSDDNVGGNFGYKGEGTAGMPQRLFSRVLLAEQPLTNGEETGPAGYAGVDDLGPGTPDTAWTRDAGLGAPGNAGSGGGGVEDAGGGGGGNFGRGGSGGWGVTGTGSEGIGGAPFPQHFAVAPQRMVMGGGGGASNGDDTGALDLTVSSGQAGGGIVFVRSVGIVTTGGGVVSANGDSGGLAASEGGGGGGAGGTVVVHTANSSVDGIAFTADGGAGGSSSQTLDGGGGGGSGGVIWLSDTSLGSATFSVAGGPLGTGATGGSYDGTAGAAGAQFSTPPIAPFDCNFVTLGIAKELTSQTRIGTSGAVFDLAFTLTVENFTATDAINVQVTDDLAAAFPSAVSIAVQGIPNLGGFTSPGVAYDGAGQVNLLEGSDTMPGNSVRVISYVVRVDFGADTGPFTTQASVTSSQIANGFAQVLDLSDLGTDPDSDGDGNPSETLANGGDAEENDATPVVLDLVVNPADCTFMPNPAAPDSMVTASCTGVETGGSVTIPGMTCGAESGGVVSCSGTASDIGSNPDITTMDLTGNVVMMVGDFLVVADSDLDGIADVLEGSGDSDGDGIPDRLDTDSDNDGIPDSDEETGLPPLSGFDSDGDGIDDALDVDITGGADLDGDGIDDALVTTDTDGDGIANYIDVDSDNDGIPDSLEGNVDTDGDGLANYLDTDSDNDGIPDSMEADNLPLIAGTDADADGIDDAFDVDVTGGADLDGNGVDDATEPVDSDVDGLPDYLDLDSDADGIADFIEGVIDSDTDGVANWRDIDSDNDGISDDAEESSVPAFTGVDSDADGIDDAIDVTSTGGADLNADGIDDATAADDFDGDSQANYLDTDSDNDRVPDIVEGNSDFDSDGAPNFLDLDSDFDGIADSVEADNVPLLVNMDTDADGLDDALDVDQTGGADIDGDGIDDLLQPVDTDADGMPDYLDLDSDADGIADAIEGTVDTDSDGTGDWRDIDSDSDGILDSAEGPTGKDADADGIDDAYDPDATGEVDADGNGVVDDLLSVDVDGNGVPDADRDNDGLADFRDLDSDNDAINDVEEAGVADTDGDGLADMGTMPIGGAALPDADGDGNPDFQEIDSDNDGTFDIAGSPDADADGDADGRIDDATDSDTDGIADVVDGAFGFGDRPAVDTDSDADGIPDIVEGSGDTDGDGIPDRLDNDSDNDGIPDAIEGAGFPTLSGLDSDGDGIDDALDVDVTGGMDLNNDGIDDAFSAVDTDGDGLADYLDVDSDNDRIPDRLEGTTDSDGDGMPNYLDTDSDNDGIPDSVEADNLLMFTGTDADADGIDDAFDVDVTGGADLDGNGFDDALEPVDTDGDGVPDYLDIDTDADGIPDAIEGVIDTDGDGTGNWRDTDADGDGILDSAEGPSGNDVDADSIDDAYDADVTGLDDSNGDGIIEDLLGVDSDMDGTPDADTDSDGVPDYLDLDADNDTINDVVEAGLTDDDGDALADPGTTPVGAGSLPDSDSDGLPDFQDVDSNNDGTFDITDNDNSSLDGDGDGRVDDDSDTDGDGIPDSVDGLTGEHGSPADADMDGISDANEGFDVNTGSGPDSDGDGIPDYLDLDSDNDGIPDELETRNDADSDGTGNWRDEDSDDDGISDADESDRVPPLNNDDADLDGWPNGIDIDTTGGSDQDGNGADDGLQPNDTDGDGLPDYLDIDSDADGYPDEIETTVDTDGDGVGDWRDTDSDNDGIPDAAESGDTDGDGIPDRIDIAEGKLETAVSGVGSMGPLMLLVLLLALMGMLKRRRDSGMLFSMLLACALFLPEQSFAEVQLCPDSVKETAGCWYAGGGLGITHVDPEGQANGWSTNDDEDTGWKIYLGYQFKPLWSAELSYVDGGEAGLGNISPALEAMVPGASIDYSTPSLMALRWWKEQEEPFNLFLKLGVSSISNSASDSRIPFDKQTSIQLAGGAGAQYTFAEHWFVRGDLDLYDRDHHYIGISIGRRFGRASVSGASHGASATAPRVSETVPDQSQSAIEAAAALSDNADVVPVTEEQCREQVIPLQGVEFETNSDELTAGARSVLNSVLAELMASESISHVAQVLAHTDSQGAADYNLKLSKRRARSVVNYLVAAGVAADRLESEGLGETRPIADNATDSGRQKNRRVEIILRKEQCQ